jgi:hypothetical protein
MQAKNTNTGITSAEKTILTTAGDDGTFHKIEKLPTF